MHTPETPNTPTGNSIQAGASKIQGLLFGGDVPAAPAEPATPPAPPVDPEPENTALDPAEEPEIEDDDSDAESEVDDETDDEPSPPQTYTVTVDGEKVDVTLDEALKGYQRQADYTRKTQKLATDRKEFEQERTSTRELRQKYAASLAQFEAKLRELEPEEPDWDTLQRENPEQYALTYTDWQRAEKKRAKLREEAERVAGEERVEFERQFEEYHAGEQRKLEAAIPDLADSEKRPKLVAALSAYALATGLSEQELRTTTDHRVLVYMDKARRYDAIMARKQKTTGKPRSTPTASPGTPRQRADSTVEKERAKLRGRLKESGSVKTAADYIQGLL